MGSIVSNFMRACFVDSPLQVWLSVRFVDAGSGTGAGNKRVLPAAWHETRHGGRRRQSGSRLSPRRQRLLRQRRLLRRELNQV